MCQVRIVSKLLDLNLPLEPGQLDTVEVDETGVDVVEALAIGGSLSAGDEFD